MGNEDRDYIVIKQGDDEQWYWGRFSANHEEISSGEGFTRKQDALIGAERANPGVAKILYYDELPANLAAHHMESDSE